MEVATLVLLHSPLVRSSTWGELPSRLRERGYDVVVVDVADDDEPPYAATYVARAAQQVTAAAPSPPIGLVGHSGAGPLLPQLGFAQRAARRRVGAYVFLDATLPRAGSTRLDLLRAEDGDLAHRLRADLGRGVLVPTWTDQDLAASGLTTAQRADVLSAVRPRGLAFFEEPLPHPDDWPDAPCGYLQTSRAYDPAARVAGLRGFAVTRAEGGHFAALAAPAQLAGSLADLVVRM